MVNTPLFYVDSLLFPIARLQKESVNLADRKQMKKL